MSLIVDKKSIYSLAIMVYARFVGVSSDKLEFIDVEDQKEQSAPSLIVENGSVITETSSILQYFGEKFDATYSETQLKEIDNLLTQEWLSFFIEEFYDKFITEVTTQTTKERNTKKNNQKHKKLLDQLKANKNNATSIEENTIDRLNEFLRNKTYLSSHKPTFCDIALYAALHNYVRDLTSSQLEIRKPLRRWFSLVQNSVFKRKSSVKQLPRLSLDINPSKIFEISL